VHHHNQPISTRLPTFIQLRHTTNTSAQLQVRIIPNSYVHPSGCGAKQKHNSRTVDIVLGCNAMWVCRYMPTFWRNNLYFSIPFAFLESSIVFFPS
jgi:hypothetical protein